jgi:hypothetical protein
MRINLSSSFIHNSVSLSSNRFLTVTDSTQQNLHPRKERREERLSIERTRTISSLLLHIQNYGLALQFGSDGEEINGCCKRNGEQIHT